MLAGNIRPIYSTGECEIDLARRELRIVGSPVPISGRAFEIVEVLVQSAGELVTKDELMNSVWPGAVVTENALHVHVVALRKALGPYRGLLKTESCRGYRLLGNWTVQDREATRPSVGLRRMSATGEPPVTNFPAAVAPLVGRSAAQQTLQTLISARRLVTLTGPGGIGKTALALQVARRVLGEFADGGWLVELAPLSAPDLVPAAVARALGLRLGSHVLSPEAVAQPLAEKNLLLVLDNCEHVIDATALLAEAFMRACPRVTILATSREIFRIAGEYAFPVSPLEVPTEGQLDAVQILGHSAPELFIVRARELGADFSSDAETLQTVATVCRCLDGMPLAIEFAAARAASLGVARVAAELRGRFATLTSGRRMALPRHQTLRATLDWSYELLTERERLLLGRLAVFAGRFTLEAARFVTTYGEAEIADGIASLVAKSLVASDTSKGEAYFRLLETTRLYALEKLNESGELQELRRRHAEYYRVQLEGMRHEQRQEAFGAHIDNVRAALEWSFGPTGNLVMGVRLAAAAGPMFLAMSLLYECHRWSQRALSVLDNAALGGCEEMHLQASLAASSMQTAGGSDATRDALSRGLAVADARGDVFNQVGLLGMLSMFHIRSEDFRAALYYARRSRAVNGIEENPAAMALANSILGRSLQFVGDHNGSCVALETSFGQWSSLQGAGEIYLGVDYRILGGICMARNLWVQGYPEQATERIRRIVKDAERKKHPASLGLALSYAPEIFLWTGDLRSAEEYADWLISHAKSYALAPCLAMGRGHQGAVAIRRGDATAGVESLQASSDQLCAMRYGRTGFRLSIVRGLMEMGQFSKSLRMVDETIKLVEANGNLLHMPEALRLRGNILLSLQQRQVHGAEMCFIRSLDWSRRQGARSWALRTAIDLAALWAAEGQSGRAQGLLRPIVESFTEGWDTADLKAAGRLLTTLL